MKDIVEVLARMWIECDPNRGGGMPGSGLHPDDPMPEMSGDLKDAPRWKWFLPRSEASLAYLHEHGYCIERLPDLSLNTPVALKPEKHE